jgi:protein tyrosine/serine phosphatase
MELTELPFSLPGRIYRSAMPFSSYDPDGELIHAYDINSITLIVMLASDEEGLRITGRDLRSVYNAHGFDVIYLPIPDFSTPKVDDLKDLVQQVLAHSRSGGAVAIHCHAGIGRTGMLAACLAKCGMGYSSEDAIQWVRDYIPGAIEVPGQEQLVRSLRCERW